MRFDDDDLEDYGEYNDDEAAVGEVRAAVPQASEDDAWDTLEKFDFDVDASIAHLKAKFKPKPAPKAAPKAPAAKPLPKAAAASTPTASKAPAPATAPATGKSKLQQLALKKQGGTGDALAKLRKGDKPSALAGLLKKKAEKSASEASSPSASSSTSKSASPGPETLAPTPSTASPAPLIATPEIPHVELAAPSSFGSLLGYARTPKFSVSVSNSVAASSVAQTKFAEPSPDDVVKGAQTAAFAPGSASKASQPKPKTKAKAKDLSAIAALSLKKHLSFVVIGHVDAGKSTLMGRLLLDAGAVTQRQIDNHAREAEKLGKSSFALAWVMDATSEERERGVTVDVGEADFETQSTRFTVVDAPGHRDYVPNMIAGVSQADVAVLVVDSDTNAFESGFSLDGQTKEHAILARSLGIETVVVAVNKLDTQAWSEERYEDITVQLTEFLSKTVGFPAAKLVFVPTSGRDGDYVLRRSDAAPWYKGPTLVEALEAVNVRERALDGPFRFICSNVYQEDFAPHTTLLGRCVSGVAEAGDPLVNCSDPASSGSIKSIVGKNYAVPGEVAELKVDLDVDLCRPGDVFAAEHSALGLVSEFVAKIILFDVKRPVLVGATLSFYLGRVNKSIKVKAIEATFDKKGAELKKKSRHLTKGQAARVRFALAEPVVLAPFAVVRDLGRFVLRIDGSTIGGGIIESVGDQ